MQPVGVRPGSQAGRYTLIAGERRWRAAQRAGLTALPAMVREVDDQAAAELALIENLQREDLNPIERAEAFQRLANEFELSHDAIAEQVGLDRSTVTNLMRLLKLCPPCRQLVRDGLLSMGQARALASVSDDAQQQALAERVVRDGLTVRAVEQAVRELGRPTGSAGKPAASASSTAGPSPHLVDLQRQLTDHLGTKVQIKPGRKQHTGTLAIEYFDNTQFEKLLEQLGLQLD
jgi:ParB family chromosome partitioning protein